MITIATQQPIQTETEVALKPEKDFPPIICFLIFIVF